MTKRFLTGAALALWVAFGAAFARAQPDGEKPWQGGLARFFFEPKVGALLFANKGVRDFYNAGNFYAGMRAGLTLKPHSLVLWPGHRLPGTLALTAEGGFSMDSGKDTSPPNEDLELALSPFSAGLEWAPLRDKEEMPFVPFVGAGFGGGFFREKVKLTPAQVTDGVRWGWNAEGGVRFLMDYWDRSAARSFERNEGIRNTWIGLRGRYQRMRMFDPGLDLSNFTFDLSMQFEM